MPRPELSLVIPIYNEEECLPQLDVRLKELLRKLEAVDASAEVVFVNDGSKDKSIELLRRMASHELRYRVLGFSRNFGHQRAITAGMDKSRGHAVVVMDADLQDPPEVILDMVAKWREGFDVVYGRRRSRKGESFFKLLTAKIFYRLFAAMIPIEVPLDTGDFRLMSRRVVTTMRGLRETHRFVRGLVAWVGFKQTAVEYDRAARVAGETKYPLRKMLAFAIDGIASFSIQPLRLATYVGAIVGTASVLYGIGAVVSWWAGLTLPGWTTTVVLVSFLFSVQFFMIGVLGEYVGRIYEQVKRRPLYIVSERINFGKRKVERLITQDIEEFQNAEDTAVNDPLPRPPPAPMPAPMPPVVPVAFPATEAPTEQHGFGEIPPPPAALGAALAAVEASTSAASSSARPPPTTARSPSRAPPPALPPTPPTPTTAKPPPPKLSSSVANIHVAPKVAPSPSTPPPPPTQKVTPSTPPPKVTPSTPPVKFPTVPPRAAPAAPKAVPTRTKSGQQAAISPDDTSRDGLPKANPNVVLGDEASPPPKKSTPPRSDPKSVPPKDQDEEKDKDNEKAKEPAKNDAD